MQLPVFSSFRPCCQTIYCRCTSCFVFGALRPKSETSDLFNVKILQTAQFNKGAIDKLHHQRGGGSISQKYYKR